MATIEQHEELIEQINQKLNQILSYQIEQLTREGELGNQLSFKEIETMFIKVIDLFKKVKETNIFEVPYNILTQFSAQLDNAISYFDQCINFNANQGNPVQVRNQIINKFRNSYDNYVTHSIPILTIGLLKGIDISLERAKLKGMIEEFEKDKEKTKIESEKKIKELNDILTNAKSAANQVGVSKHSIVFREESDFHNTESKKWLKYTVCILIGIVVIGIGLSFLGREFSKTTTQVLQFSITKLIILSTLFYALSLTNRNYKAHKHNSIVNKHRQNALTTFETFSAAAGDDIQTKNAILLETTHSIFSSQQTGYMQNENDSESPNRIIEIFKNVSNKNE